MIADPVNVDRPIQELQQALAALPWIEKSFGRAFDSYKVVDGRPYIYPQVWQGPGKDLLEVMPNDNLKSQVFWRLEDPIAVVEYVPDGYSQMRASVSGIFWFKYTDIDDTLNYPFIELLKGSAQRAITTALLTDSSVEITRIWEGADNVYRGYTLDKIAKQELVYPFGGFRIDCDLTFLENCPDAVYGLPE